MEISPVIKVNQPLLPDSFIIRGWVIPKIYKLAEVSVERIVGTTIWGLRAPVFRQGDDLSQIVPALVTRFLAQENLEVGTKDVVAITESVVARTQGNYVHIDAIARDINTKFDADNLGVIFPIYSRNRFAIILRGIALSKARKITLMLSYPSDEVGNHLVSMEQLDEAGVDPYTDTLSEPEFRRLFGYGKHTFTGVDYVSYYSQLITDAGKECEVVFSNTPRTILDFTRQVINCDIHTRKRTKRILLAAGAEKCYSLDEILTEPISGSGYNPEFGLLGSNKSSEEKLKLFPRDSKPLVERIQARLLELTGKTIEVMIYGDGAFKDPVGKIWELADPVVSPGYTSGLEGTPNEIKLKYIADTVFADLVGQELEDGLKDYIKAKSDDLVGSMVSQGTTPRRLTDLLGSLCDLTSGSGDKGTPIIYIKGYFDNYTR